MKQQVIDWDEAKEHLEQFTESESGEDYVRVVRATEPLLERDAELGGFESAEDMLGESLDEFVDDAPFMVAEINPHMATRPMQVNATPVRAECWTQVAGRVFVSTCVVFVTKFGSMYAHFEEFC